MLSTISKIFGSVLLVLGIAGFIPAWAPEGELLGIFHVDTLHNLIHLGSAAAALAAGFISQEASQMYFRVFGFIYALVAILGLIYMENDILGILANDLADTLLHVLIAGTALVLGFSKTEKAALKT